MKRLIVCCDGTWQNLDREYPTNVVKITQAIKTVDSRNIHQVLYYSEGIGTGTSKVDRWFGGAFGWGIDQRIQNAYRFLCCNYESGDEIYLFGFSRGSYTVRSLAGLIYKCGLLQRCYLRKAIEAYALYRDRNVSPSSEKAVNFRQNYAVRSNHSQQETQIPITLLGCWDTVGSMGVPNTFLGSRWLNKKYRFHNTKLNPKIQHALHAVAIDECRSVFDVTHMRPHEDSQNPHQVTEVWFAGTHGCVGGGSAANCGLSDIALQWMMDKIQEIGLGLEFVDNPNEVVEGGIKVDPSILFDTDIRGIYAFLQTKNRSLIDKEDKKTQLDTHFFEHKIHTSVKERWRLLTLKPPYRPQTILAFEKWFEEILH
jgi:uncharacterized protein (DUF2235 family)